MRFYSSAILLLTSRRYSSTFRVPLDCPCHFSVLCWSRCEISGVFTVWLNHSLKTNVSEIIYVWKYFEIKSLRITSVLLHEFGNCHNIWINFTFGWRMFVQCNPFYLVWFESWLRLSPIEKYSLIITGLVEIVLLASVEILNMKCFDEVLVWILIIFLDDFSIRIEIITNW
jgi:hypothetical protein